MDCQRFKRQYDPPPAGNEEGFHIRIYLITDSEATKMYEQSGNEGDIGKIVTQANNILVKANVHLQVTLQSNWRTNDVIAWGDDLENNWESVSSPDHQQWLGDKRSYFDLGLVLSGRTYKFQGKYFHGIGGHDDACTSSSFIIVPTVYNKRKHSNAAIGREVARLFLNSLITFHDGYWPKTTTTTTITTTTTTTTSRPIVTETVAWLDFPGGRSSWSRHSVFLPEPALKWPVKCTCPETVKCIFDIDSVSLQIHKCYINELKKRIHQRGRVDCLTRTFSVTDSVISICGNGIQETNEECDCPRWKHQCRKDCQGCQRVTTTVTRRTTTTPSRTTTTRRATTAPLPVTTTQRTTEVTESSTSSHDVSNKFNQPTTVVIAVVIVLIVVSIITLVSLTIYRRQKKQNVEKRAQRIRQAKERSAKWASTLESLNIPVPVVYPANPPPSEFTGI